MEENSFETYWLQHRQTLLQANEEYRRVSDSYKMKTGADWLLFGIPFFAGILFMNVCALKSELLRWLLSALVTIVCYVICVWVKSLTTGERPMSEIEADIKEEAKKEWNRRQKVQTHGN